MNRLSAELLPEEESVAVDVVDALMEDLYQRGELFCPGHRWLTERPASIRGHLVSLYERGAIGREPETGSWGWSRWTSYIHVRPSASGSPEAEG